MVDFRLRDYWTIARGIRQGNSTLIKTMEALSLRTGIAGKQAAMFVQQQQLKETA